MGYYRELKGRQSFSPVLAVVATLLSLATAVLARP